MGYYHRYQQVIKKKMGEDGVFSLVCTTTNSITDNNVSYYKRTKPKLLPFLFISLFSCFLFLVTHFFCSSSFYLIYSSMVENNEAVHEIDAIASLCSSVPVGTVCCDRSSIRSDICIAKGDIRTHSASSSLFVYGSNNSDALLSNSWSVVRGDMEVQRETIKPYTRKWESSVMDAIDELGIVMKKANFGNHHCDVKHDVPAVFFSTGGYTGNVYHEFNDGILPLYITTQHLNKKVVFVILEYHNWWMTKYRDILSHLSEYPAIDFSGDNRTHCFPEAIVGLQIHDELTVDPSLMKGGKSIVDFRNLLDQAYWPRIRGLIRDEERKAQDEARQLSLSPSSATLSQTVKEEIVKKPKLVILSRNSSRTITNEDLLVKMAKETGFQVEVLRPDRTTELAKIYRALNSSDVMIGVHGAAMTHFLFMRPGTVFIQVIPLGTDWAAENYYGEPARKLGLKYIGYKVLLKESSLYDKYDKDDPVLQDPDSVVKKGWQFTKTIYLDDQNVILNLRRFQKRLVRAHRYCIMKKAGPLSSPIAVTLST